MRRLSLFLYWSIMPAMAVAVPLSGREARGQNSSLVPKIGSIMRKFGEKNQAPEWEKAAKLQDLWLAFPAHAASPASNDTFDFSTAAWPAQTGITIDWTLNDKVDSNGRASAAFKQLQDAITSDPNNKMRDVIIKQVNRMFASTSANAVDLGTLKLAQGVDLRAYHAQQVQFRGVPESLTDPLDPLFGALGAFNYYAIPLGRAQKLADGSCRVDISDFSVYIIDSFDYQGDQELGFWKEPDLIAKTPFGGGTRITNKDYRDYRGSAAAQGKGGDFLVVSDAHTVHLPKSFTFTPDASANGTWASTDQKHRFALAINGSSVNWTETGPETGIAFKAKLAVTQQGNTYRIERPNDTDEILKMLGFGDATLRQAILQNGPHASFLEFRTQNGQLVATWKGIRVKKTPQGAFKSLVQPEDATNAPGSYTLQRAN